MTIKHVAAGNILRNGKMYFKGDPIEFEDREAEHVAELLANGALAGPEADEREALRLYNEFQTKMHGMSKAEMQRLWGVYLKQDAETRLAREQAEARAKTDAQAATLANADEAAPAEAPVEDEGEEIARITRGKK